MRFCSPSSSLWSLLQNDSESIRLRQFCASPLAHTRSDHARVHASTARGHGPQLLPPSHPIIFLLKTSSRMYDESTSSSRSSSASAARLHRMYFSFLPGESDARHDGTRGEFGGAGDVVPLPNIHWSITIPRANHSAARSIGRTRALKQLDLCTFVSIHRNR